MPFKPGGELTGRLRFVLALVLAVALFPLLMIAVAQTWSEAREEQRVQRDRMIILGALAASELNESIARAQGVVDAVSTRGFAFMSAPGGCSRAMAQIASGDTVLTNIALTDADGEIICSGLEGAQNLNMASEDWHAALSSGEQQTVSGVLMGPVSRTPILVVANRLGQESVFRGTAAAAIDVLRASRILIDNAMADGSQVLLVTPTEAREVDRSRMLKPASIDIQSDLLESVLQIDQPQPTRIRFEGVDRPAVLAPLVEGQLALLLVSPTPTTQWGLVSVAATFLVPLLMYALALASVWLAVDHYVLRWLGYLRRIAAVYGGGRLDVVPVRARNAPREIRELANTMGEMAASLEKQQNELESAVDQRGALLKEIHHRVKNNLQIIVSLLNLQAGRMTDGEGRTALMEARRRINALSLVHRSLYEADDLRAVYMPGFLNELALNLQQASDDGSRSVSVQAECDDVSFEPDTAVPVALFVAEAVTNAYKHAFTSRTQGRILISLKADSPEVLTLRISDDGEGMTDTASQGTGSSLMEAFAMQLDGRTWSEPNADGGMDFVLQVGEKKN
ncbi:sensor histidine kinase [Oceanicaulis alexandrii]|uniref:sensor histidine kinase n=1 Tax=Oceanicaulis alexandrii TaxID=153233 RepID=UPI0003B530FB|nr:sensor histidine kinase [Oceanicaulis alexandrii]